MLCTEISTSQVPQALLLEADPSEHNIRQYMRDAWCYVVKAESQIVAACVVGSKNVPCVEIFNVSVLPAFQQQGIGTKLLKYVLAGLVEKQAIRVELSTGAFGYQLTYYQRLGFRVGSVVKDHFVRHYAEPIIEDGIQHKDALRLYINLGDSDGV
ncbi:GNAT family N-acetyltransferase [Pseudoalteromonas rubra]|uniref:GCN5 family acetyltransferase n=1 Tax=Pseudoalteromonas rubra TaxID=43658 RepID=A0A0U3HZ83_9GAMM|nr:GNAT family N-acetyltransferase [Pseudoalteromonas rubra]ALU42982.1 GCN5 family acetyltransferase [Pseudoalteromonas rubra]